MHQSRGEKAKIIPHKKVKENFDGNLDTDYDSFHPHFSTPISFPKFE
jgi:hypothetical protein